jgi:hypothetical protein
VRQNRPDDEIDRLFTLPLDEFTSARNALATRLKKNGKSEEADQVKSLTKPSVSAWAVNQLYWTQRDEFDRLMATGQGFRDAQASQLAGKAGSMREQAEARREALAELLRLADGLLRASGHNPSSETLRRVSTTLEALSAYASLPNPLTMGRLSEDLSPPGFEILAGLTPAAHPVKPSTPATPSKTDDPTDRATMAAAQRSLDEAESSLKEARDRAKKIETELKRNIEEARVAAKQKREAEEIFKRATAVAEEADRRANRTVIDAEAAAKELQHAERVREQASQEVDRLRGRSKKP